MQKVVYTPFPRSMLLARSYFCKNAVETKNMHRVVIDDTNTFFMFSNIFGAISYPPLRLPLYVINIKGQFPDTFSSSRKYRIA